MLPANNRRGKTRPSQKHRLVLHTAVISLLVLIAIGNLLTIRVIDDKSSHSFNPFQLISNLVHRSGGNSRSIAQQVATSTEVVGQTMPYRILCNGTFQKSQEARFGMGLASSRCTSLHNNRYGVQQTATSANINPSNVTGYHVVGKQIVDNQGNVFIPYGVQLDGILMAQSNWTTDRALTYLTQAQVQAAHDFWHANTVSLQLGSRALFDQRPFDKTYLAAADNVVSWAKQLGMNVLFVLQYEGYGNSSRPMPTQDSIHFWNVLSSHYATSTNVFFDIFNEPNPATPLGHIPDNDTVWSFWQNGGTINGTTYIGMQQLVNTIRNNGFKSLIFVDGAASGEDINLLSKHTLTGINIVYAIHPYLDSSQHGTQAGWNAWFGNATVKGNFPVEADEWSQYQDQYSFNAGSCLTNAPTVVPQLLAYLRSKNIGLIGYALFPGILIRGWNFRDPTTFDRNHESCPIVSFPDYSSTAQGAGQLLENYFAKYSKQ